MYRISYLSSSQDFWLRLDLDEQLSFDVHIDSLCKKISKRIGILNRIKAYLPRTEFILYDNSLIKPLILYCSVTWTSCCSHDNLYFFKLVQSFFAVFLKTTVANILSPDFHGQGTRELEYPKLETSYTSAFDIFFVCSSLSATFEWILLKETRILCK